MSDQTIKNSSMWLPERSFGVCIYFTNEDQALSDGDGVLCAEGIIGDGKVEKKVLEAGKYWTSEDGGYVKWVAGGRKVSASEREDQMERLLNGLVADPFEDMIDNHFNKK
jgi:hypothetical protein